MNKLEKTQTKVIETEKESKSLVKKSKKTLLIDQVPSHSYVNLKFGKNGSGLTTEFHEIAEIVEEESKKGQVFLISAFADPLDDVYELNFKVEYPEQH